MSKEYQNFISIYGTQLGSRSILLDELIEEIQKKLAITFEEFSELSKNERVCLIQEIPGFLTGQKFREANMFSQREHLKGVECEYERVGYLSDFVVEELRIIKDKLTDLKVEACIELHKIIHCLMREDTTNYIEGYDFCRLKEVTTINNSFSEKMFMQLSKGHKKCLIHWAVVSTDGGVEEYVILNGEVLLYRNLDYVCGDLETIIGATHNWVLSRMRDFSQRS